MISDHIGRAKMMTGADKTFMTPKKGAKTWTKNRFGLAQAKDPALLRKRLGGLRDPCVKTVMIFGSRASRTEFRVLRELLAMMA